MSTATTFKSDSLACPVTIGADGIARIGDTRIWLETVVDYYNDHISPEAMVRYHPVLSLPMVYAAIAYYLDRREEVDQYIARLRAEREALVEKYTSTPEYKAFISKMQSKHGKTGSP